MVTDSPPRKRNFAGFQESDRRKTVDLPQDDHLLVAAKSIEVAMNEETIACHGHDGKALGEGTVLGARVRRALAD
jgi:hypothetical protein